MTAGIYGIFNRDTGRVYVGMTANVQTRWQQHRHALRFGRHTCTQLQADWQHYGPDGFEFRMIEVCDDGEYNVVRVGALECKWVDHYGPLLYGYVEPKPTPKRRPREGPAMLTRTFSIRRDQAEWLKREARSSHISVSAYARRMIDGMIDGTLAGEES